MKAAIVLALAATLIGANSADAKSKRKPADARAARAATSAPQTDGFGYSGQSLVFVARLYIGGNPTDLARLWCGRFMRFVIRKATGRDPGPQFDAAMSYARIGHPGPPGAGAIVYWPRGAGRGHVGIIARLTGPGRAIVISGNDGPAGGRQVMERERSLAGAGFRYL